MKKTILSTLACSSILLFSGCGGGSTDTNTLEEIYNKLLGTWIYAPDGSPNGCVADNDDNSSIKMLLTFEQSDFRLHGYEYNNTVCDTNGLQLDIVYTFEYVVVGKDIANTGHTSYKMRFTKTNVKVNKKEDNITLGSDTFNTGQTLKNEFLFDGGHLVFSKDSNDTYYPNDFNLSDYFTRQ